MSLLDLIYPKNCLECHRNGTYICLPCLNKVRKVGYCVRVGGIDRRISLWKYEGVIKKAIWAMKYRFVRGLADELGDLVVTELRRRKIELQDSILVPIPLSNSRARWRGFNQAQIVAEKIGKGLGSSVENRLLLRVKTGDTQVGRGRQERVRNIRGVYAVNEDIEILRYEDIKLILVDDVWTTGATVVEAAKVLKRAGVKEVLAITVCG